MSARPLVVIGCGGHGRVLADIARSCGMVVEGFLDDRVQQVPDGPLLGPINDLVPKLAASHDFAIGIGEAAQRRRCAEIVRQAGGSIRSLIHPTAVVARRVELGRGIAVMAGVVINTGTRIGDLAVINTGALVDHDNLIEENAQVAPGCVLAGAVKCGRDAFVGAGAVVIPRVSIGEGAVVAAGAVVIRDVAPCTLVAGCPARVKKSI